MELFIKEFKEHKLNLLDLKAIESTFKSRYPTIDIVVFGSGYVLRPGECGDFRKLDKQAKELLSSNIFLKILIKERHKKAFDILTEEREAEIKELEAKSELTENEKATLWQLRVITNKTGCMES